MSSIDYTSKDFASFRDAMLLDATTKLPEWTNRAPNDFGVVLIEEFAYVADILSYYIDRMANESFLNTATLRSSILNIAQMLDYRPDSGQPAQTVLTISVTAGTGTVFIPAGSQFSSPSDRPDIAPVVIFETNGDLYINQSATQQVSGTVAATEGQTFKGESVGSSNGQVFQIFDLSRTPVIEGSPQVYVDEGSGPLPWTFVEHLIDAGPTSQAYSTFTNSFGVTEIHFGDNVNGRVPFNGAAITCTYRVGGGTIGNVGVGTVANVVNAPVQVVTVSNSLAAGGTDPESNDQIRVNAPKAFSTLHRAVSLQDYANICYNVATVAKAAATGLSYTNIVLAVAPTGGGAPTDALKQRVLTYLDDKKMVNAHITMVDPVYVPINMRVIVQVLAQFDPNHVRFDCLNALTSLTSFDNVDFGQLLTQSDIFRALSTVQGVSYVSVSVLARSTGPQNVTDIQLAALELPTPIGATIDVQTIGGIGTGTITPVGGNVFIPGQPGQPVVDSISCVSPATVDGQFALALHWSASDSTNSYTVLLDFYNGTTYVGSISGGSYTTTSANITGLGYAGNVDTMKIRVRAINGTNSTDSLVTSLPYTCGTNLVPHAAQAALSVQISNLSAGPVDSYGYNTFSFTGSWVNPQYPPTDYIYRINYLNSSGQLMFPATQGTQSAPAPTATTTSETFTNIEVPKGAISVTFQLDILNPDGSLGLQGTPVSATIPLPASSTGSTTGLPPYYAPQDVHFTSYVNNGVPAGYTERTITFALAWTYGTGTPNLPSEYVYDVSYNDSTNTPIFAGHQGGPQAISSLTFGENNLNIPNNAVTILFHLSALNPDGTLGTQSNIATHAI